MTADNFSQRVFELSRRLGELRAKCVSSQANAPEILSEALDSLQASLEELSTANEELMRQKEELLSAQMAQNESERYYRTAIDFTYDWEYWIDPHGKYIYISPSCERISGYKADEFMQDQGLLERIIHPEDRTLISDHLLHEGGPEEAIDFRIIARNGKERWISHVCQPVYGPDGDFLGRRGSNRDITERKQAEDALRTLSRQRQLALDASRMGWWSYDPATRISSWDDRCEEIFGVGATRVPMMRFLSVYILKICPACGQRWRLPWIQQSPKYIQQSTA
jgi:PAS domain S-box-containing protein